jgi:predicted transcriptional regulator
MGFSPSPCHRGLASPGAGLFFGEKMTVNERLLEPLQNGPMSAMQLSEATGLPKQTVKIALLALFKRGKVQREKKERAENCKGPKTEFVYSCAS